jgi:peptidoglycan/xylan/chitin deacetylase (PgdA/CDA1 family)/peptidoglycan hydrolase-like protein with peptidoglycan-binding domain
MTPRRIAATLSAVALGCSLSAVGALPASAAALPPSEWVVGPHQGVVLITFDGQTKVKYMTSVLRTLQKKRAKASFFVSGEWVRAHPKKARTMARSGHILGNRGFGNAAFTSLSDDTLRSSLDRARAALNDIGAYPAPFMRAPGGARDLRVLHIAGSMGYRSVRWTHHPGGGKALRVQRAVVHKARYGSIISLDVRRASHRRALPGIIDGLRRRGFKLATVKRLENVHPIRWDVTLRAGSGGPEVTFLQKVLRQRSYPAGATDGSFGYATLQATYAFEKVHGLTRDGVVTPLQMTQIVALPRPPTPRRKYHNFIDIDISRQVLFEVRNDKVVHTLPISSGNEANYTVDGETRRAHTPRGGFKILRKIEGKRVSDLGTLYWPSYFVGGYAIHGSDSVPTYPASHGCVRIPRYLEQAFFYRNPVDRPVFVHD